MSLVFHCQPQDTFFFFHFWHLTFHFPCEMKNMFNFSATSCSAAKYFTLLSGDSVPPVTDLS